MLLSHIWAFCCVFTSVFRGTVCDHFFGPIALMKMRPLPETIGKLGRLCCYAMHMSFSYFELENSTN